MKWRGGRTGGGIEDRRPDFFEIDHPYYGDIIGSQERGTGKLIRAYPVDLMEQCGSTLTSTFGNATKSTFGNLFERSSGNSFLPMFNLNYFDPDRLQTEKLGVSWLDQIFAPNSCRTKLSNFFQDTARIGINVIYENNGSFPVLEMQRPLFNFRF